MKKVFILTYGCQMNEYDTELVRSILKDAGYEIIDDELKADVVLLNTCSVRETAHRKVYGYIHDLRFRRKGRPFLMGILGCMATGLKKELLEDKSLKIDIVAGPDSYKKLPDLLQACSMQHKKDQDDTIAYDVSLSEFETYADIYPQREQGVNAWVAIMRGCNNFCAFCIVPYTRGRERSRSTQNILDEIKRLADEGYKQVTLLGQNVNSYHFQGQRFADLLKETAKIKGIERIRFTSPHPKDFPQDLIDMIAHEPKVCKQVHLPLQAGNDRVLALMNRQYTQQNFLDLVARLKKACPSLALSTDIIVGFPTETEEEFQDTMSVMNQVCFDTAFMFKYSTRPNTKAAREMKDDVSEKDKTSRIVRLNQLQTKISLQKNQQSVGQIQKILIERVKDQNSAMSYGRNDANKIVLISQGDEKIGDMIDVRIIAATPHQLKGSTDLLNSK